MSTHRQCFAVTQDRNGACKRTKGHDADTYRQWFADTVEEAAALLREVTP
ncbi:hypothetical protein [Streptomyces sp. NPDC088727]